MEFLKYQHIQRFGNREVEGIENGTIHIFPKIDGTNGSVWNGGKYWGKDVISVGSRRRELSETKDNAGFYKYIQAEGVYRTYLKHYPHHRLFGEWLVPHSLKTYRDEAWRQFYVFDVMVCPEIGSPEYLPYEVYSLLLSQYYIPYIPCIAKIENGTLEQIAKWLEKNDYLIKDGEGQGEGLVLKNYAFRNEFGDQVWAKIVTSEFREKHARVMGPVEQKGAKRIEQAIVDACLTDAMINKAYAKIVTACDGWTSALIPRYLESVFHDFITEELYQAINKQKLDVISMKVLRSLVYKRVKEVNDELF